MPSMTTKDAVFQSRRHWSPYGAVAPPIDLLDISRYKQTSLFINNTAWAQLASGLWVLTFDGTGDTVVFAASLVPVQTFITWIYPTVKNRSIVDFDAGTHSIETTNATPPLLTATGWTAPVIYVNGQIASTVITLDIWQMIAITTATSFIMSALVLGQEASDYAGKLGLPRCYNYALNADQINSIYAKERSWFDV